ncbi:heparan sulfate 2-O-sulfotransferase 1 [Aulostomus maculatus]
MALLRTMATQKFQLLFLTLFGLAVLLMEHQIHKLEDANVKVEHTLVKYELDETELLGGKDGFWERSYDQNDIVIIYNKVPKTASTSFTNVAYDLCERNLFNVLHVNTSRNTPVMSLQDQASFVHNVTNWREKKPAFFHGHFAFIDFSIYGLPTKPIYINMVRDPTERLVSYYYFLRYGDNLKPDTRRSKQGDTTTFDECVAEGGRDCGNDKLWLQVPFFCGHHSECWKQGSRWALEKAKYNLVSNYLLVGITEELEDFVIILEAVLPRFFKGATELYTKGSKSHLRQTNEKRPIKKETLAKLQQSESWQLENEFYDFAVQQFEYVRSHSIKKKDGQVNVEPKKFIYEKIHPRRK